MTQISLFDGEKPFKIMREWKPIRESNGLFEVSNDGLVASSERTVFNGKGWFVKKRKIMRLRKSAKGYVVVDIRNKFGKKLYRQVHRLVATEFLPNPNEKPQVNHKDGNKQNNAVENLEWCTNGENQIHAWKTGLQKVSGKAGRKKRPVIGVSSHSSVEFESISSAARFVGGTESNIAQCCKGKRKSAYDYKWFYKGGDEE